MSIWLGSALPEPHPVDPGSALAVLEGDLLDPSLEEVLPGLPHPILGRLTVGEALRASDLPAHFWAKPAIDAVARAHPWMEDFGASHFKPSALETRARFAHALVLAFGAGDAVDRSISFKDLAPTDPYYPFAAIAVRHHW